MKHFSLYITIFLLSVLGIVVSETNIKAQNEIDVDGDYIENPVEDAADREDADFIEGDEDVSVTETEEKIDGDTGITEEVNENYADEMDDDIFEDSVDSSDALEPKAPQAP